MSEESRLWGTVTSTVIIILSGGECPSAVGCTVRVGIQGQARIVLRVGGVELTCEGTRGSE